MGGISRGTPSSPEGDLIVTSQMRLWNTETLAWEASTKGSGVGEAVTVENFPATISGAKIPVYVPDGDCIQVKITQIPEFVIGVTSVPPSGKYKVRNFWVDPVTGKLTVEYDDTPVP
jgi:hypothetical protein